MFSCSRTSFYQPVLGTEPSFLWKSISFLPHDLLLSANHTLSLFKEDESNIRKLVFGLPSPCPSSLNYAASITKKGGTNRTEMCYQGRVTSVHCTTRSAKPGKLGHIWPLGKSRWNSVVAVHRRRRQPTPVLLPGESCGQRSLVGCHLWGCTESDTSEET